MNVVKDMTEIMCIYYHSSNKFVQVALDDCSVSIWRGFTIVAASEEFDQRKRTSLHQDDTDEEDKSEESSSEQGNSSQDDDDDDVDISAFKKQLGLKTAVTKEGKGFQ